MKIVKMDELRTSPFRRGLSKLLHRYSVILTSGAEVKYDEETCKFSSSSLINRDDQKELLELMDIWNI